MGTAAGSYSVLYPCICMALRQSVQTSISHLKMGDGGVDRLRLTPRILQSVQAVVRLSIPLGESMSKLTDKEHEWTLFEQLLFNLVTHHIPFPKGCYFTTRVEATQRMLDALDDFLNKLTNKSSA